MTPQKTNQDEKRVRCPVCGGGAHALIYDQDVSRDGDQFQRMSCARCGDFNVQQAAGAILRKNLWSDEKLKFSASARIRSIRSYLGSSPTFDIRAALALTKMSTLGPPTTSPDLAILRYLRGVDPDSRNVLHDMRAWSSISATFDTEVVLDILSNLEDRGFVVTRRTGSKVAATITEAGEDYSTLTPSARRLKTTTGPLRISALDIKGARCFSSKQTLSLTGPDGHPAKWTVVIGQNGVGKTTLLQAIAALYPVLIRQENESRLHPNATNLHQYLPNGHFRRFGSEQMEIDLFCTAPAQDGYAELVISHFSGRSLDAVFTELATIDRGISLQLGPFGTFAVGSGMDERSHIPPVIAYGATRIPAHVTLTPSEESEKSGVENLFAPNVPLRSAEEWLLKTDYAARFEGKTDSWSSNRLKKVRASILKILPDVSDIVFLPPEKDRPQPRVQFVTKYGAHGLEALSLGYQTTLSWVVDLSARLFDHYPDSEDPLSEPVLVLVDEIDLHLHPKWQRKVMEHLNSIFTHAQFIVTTHSPLVVQGIKDANLAVLKGRGKEVQILNDVEEVRSWRADQILTSDLFELSTARPLYVERLLSEEKRIKTKPTLTDADRHRLSKIADELGRLPTAETFEQNEAMDIILKAAAALRG